METCLDDPVSAGVRLSVCISSSTLIRSQDSRQIIGQGSCKYIVKGRRKGHP